MITQNNSKMENTETSNSKKIRTYAFCFVIILINIIHLYLYDDSPLSIINIKDNGWVDLDEGRCIICFNPLFLFLASILASIVFINHLLLMIYDLAFKLSDTKIERILVYIINILYIIYVLAIYIYIKTYSD